MSITFSKLKYKNFLSTGTEWNSVDFLESRKKVYTGKNSSGKSTMQDALCFVLYNKAFRKIKKNQLVNSIIGKNLETEIEFNIGNTEYIIQRGVSPTYCRLFINGILKEPGSSARDYQAFIENSILKMNERTFRQIVVLGSSDFIPFMKLLPNVKRIVVEDLLDIAIFSSMGDVTKRKLVIANKQYKTLEQKILLLRTVMENKKKTLEQLNENKKNSLESFQSDYDALLSNVKDLTTKQKIQQSIADSLLVDIKTREKEIRGIETKIKKLLTMKSKVENNISRVSTEIKFFNENDTCHVCTQDIEADFKQDKIGSGEKLKIKLNGGVSDMEKLMDVENTRINSLKNKNREASTLTTEISNELVQIKIKESKLEDLQQLINNQADVDSSWEDTIELEIEDTSTELDLMDNRLEILSKESGSLGYLIDLFKDDGIKSKIIKTYLPLINKLLRKYLDILNMNVDFQFNEFFEETITGVHKDNFSYGNFSTGQQLRIDLAIIFVWRELAKMKNSTNTNLLILDEVTSSSMDQQGIEAFNAIVDMQVESGNSVVIITHAPDNVSGHDYVTFDHKIVNNFTKIEQII